MEKVKINLSKPLETHIDLTSIMERMEFNNEYLTLFLKKTILDVSIGQRIYYKRMFYKGNGKYDIINNIGEVVERDKRSIRITAPRKDVYFIKNFYRTIDNNFRLVLNKTHNIFQQDLNNNDFSISLYDINHKLIGNINSKDISIPLRHEERALHINDCLQQVDILDNCNNECEKIRVFDYVFSPHNVSRNSILIKGGNYEWDIEDVKSIEFDYNPYFYVNNNTCKFYEDLWINSLDNSCVIYNTSGASVISICLDDAYYKINLGLSSDSNENDLGSEDYFDEGFVNEVSESFIPQFIDMERIKYAPCLNGLYLTGITFYLHFIKRAEIKDGERKKLNSIYTSGNVYYDTWHIDDDTREGTWWNGFNYNGSTFDANEFETFYKNSGKTSDLIGYLNFTDNDIYYRKKKVGKSFLRLSFYTSKDPIEQKLLYYSTIFLDDGELYGKYIKQLRNKNKEKSIVFKEDGERVDTKITITNEYNKLKSSEGFNLYLFAEDKEFDFKNDKKTIYMRVEFNHAGNGKTIPMIVWPKNNDSFYPLTVNNFFDSLYIPVTLECHNGIYTYSFDKYYDVVNNNINMVLYEPKLDSTGIILNTPNTDNDNNDDIERGNYNIIIINNDNNDYKSNITIQYGDSYDTFTFKEERIEKAYNIEKYDPLVVVFYKPIKAIISKDGRPDEEIEETEGSLVYIVKNMNDKLMENTTVIIKIISVL